MVLPTTLQGPLLTVAQEYRVVTIMGPLQSVRWPSAAQPGLRRRPRADAFRYRG